MGSIFVACGPGAVARGSGVSMQARHGRKAAHHAHLLRSCSRTSTFDLLGLPCNFACSLARGPL